MCSARPPALSACDPFGHEWSLATHLRDVTVDEETSGAAYFVGDD